MRQRGFSLGQIYEPFSQGDVTSHLPDSQLVTDSPIEKKKKDRSMLQAIVYPSTSGRPKRGTSLSINIWLLRHCSYLSVLALPFGLMLISIQNRIRIGKFRWLLHLLTV